jgi:hypothetical protein
MKKDVFFVDRRISIESLLLSEGIPRRTNRWVWSCQRELLHYYCGHYRFGFDVKDLVLTEYPRLKNPFLYEDEERERKELLVALYDSEGPHCRYVVLRGSEILSAYRLLADPSLAPEGFLEAFLGAMECPVIDGSFELDCVLARGYEYGR